MFTKRIIPCLDVNDGRVVKGINFVNLRDAGDPVEVAALKGNGAQADRGRIEFARHHLDHTLLAGLLHLALVPKLPQVREDRDLEGRAREQGLLFRRIRFEVRNEGLGLRKEVRHQEHELRILVAQLRDGFGQEHDPLFGVLGHRALLGARDARHFVGEAHGHHGAVPVLFQHRHAQLPVVAHVDDRAERVVHRREPVEVAAPKGVPVVVKDKKRLDRAVVVHRDRAGLAVQEFLKNDHRIRVQPRVEVHERLEVRVAGTFGGGEKLRGRLPVDHRVLRRKAPERRLHAVDLGLRPPLAVLRDAGRAGRDALVVVHEEVDVALGRHRHRGGFVRGVKRRVARVDQFGPVRVRRFGRSGKRRGGDGGFRRFGRFGRVDAAHDASEIPSREPGVRKELVQGRELPGRLREVIPCI